MSQEMDDLRGRMYQAFDELLNLYRLLEQENDLLREQLRRHPVGELQIRETERKMLEVKGGAALVRHERLRELLASHAS
ncbi:MAG TPA: hypothetical protein VFG49_01775 [Dyella sp.]|uniref:hypothetical protein n=1 Tax=Dyella sp. TaxID=1869338 RepID=UPI002D79F61A|nr:hypothetical protein [Dyella sp.]HET6552241.1 hypothetical protein [Dyella sp.]